MIYDLVTVKLTNKSVRQSTSITNFLNFYVFYFVSDTIAFHSVLTSYSTIPDGSNILFNEIILNQGDGYVQL